LGLVLGESLAAGLENRAGLPASIGVFLVICPEVRILTGGYERTVGFGSREAGSASRVDVLPVCSLMWQAGA